MKLSSRLAVIFTVLFGCVGCDQVTKSMAEKYFKGNDVQTWFHDFLRISYAENSGAFLSLGGALPEETRFWLFTVLVGAVIAGLLVYLVIDRQQDVISLVALSLILSGGVSNLYDRILNDGAVIDFLNVGIGAYRTGIFNVADMAVMLGAAIIALRLFRDFLARHETNNQ